jgi:hypothetical protein
VAALKNITVDALEFSIRGYFDRRGDRLPDLHNRGFEGIRYETRIQSPEPAERIEELVEEAEPHCYVLSQRAASGVVTYR